MPINKKVEKCPKNNNIKPKDSKCVKCEFYNPKKWYNYHGEVEVFCTFDLSNNLRDILKSGKFKKDKKNEG